MNQSGKKLLFLALIIAIIATVAVLLYVSGLKKPAQSEVEYINVAVAIENIEKSSVITEKVVKIEKIATQFANEAALNDIKLIVGKRAKDNIYKGEQIIPERIADGRELGFSYTIPQGFRAISVNVNEAIEVADFIRPGDWVDVIATFDQKDFIMKGNGYFTPKVTKTILQNIRVLGMGQKTEISEKERKTDALPKTVTLAVKPEDIGKLVFSEEAGVIKLVLRNIDDHNVKRINRTILFDIVENLN